MDGKFAVFYSQRAFSCVGLIVCSLSWNDRIHYYGHTERPGTSTHTMFGKKEREIYSLVKKVDSHIEKEMENKRGGGGIEIEYIYEPALTYTTCSKDTGADLYIRCYEGYLKLGAPILRPGRS